MKANSSLPGLLSALGAYLIWGFSVILFKQLKAVPPFEILMHRMIWSFFLLIALVLIFKRRRAMGLALKSFRTLRVLLVSTLLVGCNWGIFIWAVNNDHILDASLGYFICPLVNIVLGAVILHERLRRLQRAAVFLAAAAVLYLTLHYGTFPWVALMLAVSFGFYGLLRKTAPVEALEGLTVETLLMFLPAAGYLLWLDRHGTGAFLHVNGPTDLLLTATALVTAVPLLLFTFGARRLSLATIGILQYIAPSCNFLLAVFYYHEPFTSAQLYTFCAIWMALGIYSYDAVLQVRRMQRI
jgi:chloramphenicol-sensitive protein RarD